VPVLVSGESGLGDLLREILDAEISRRTVIPVGKDPSRDSAVWADAISEVLADREGSFALAAEIRDILADGKSWQASVQALLAAL
jgi:hypothetical protein